jgi:ABC-type phosphate transport system auxiliary subunit
MAGVGTYQHTERALYHDKESGQYAVRLAEIDHQLAKQNKTNNPDLELSSKFASLAADVRKAEDVRAYLNFNLQQLNEIEADLAQLRKRYKVIPEELKALLAEKNEVRNSTLVSACALIRMAGCAQALSLNSIIKP